MRARDLVAVVVAAAGCASPAPRGMMGLADGGADLAGGVAEPPAALPMGAISLFRGGACPEGWAPYEAAVGRTIVPTVGDAAPGNAQGDPLADREDRGHGHSLAATVDVPSISYVGAAGGGNRGVGAAGKVSLATTTEKSPLGLPYVQLLVCRKIAAARPGTVPLPRGLLMFFSAPGCPDGWTRAAGTQGRLLVGLPDNGTAGLAFGGDPLAAGERRDHRHEANGLLATMPHGIALAAGCCASGYARNGSYPFKVMSEAGAVGMPYVQLLQCQKL